MRDDVPEVAVAQHAPDLLLVTLPRYSARAQRVIAGIPGVAWHRELRGWLVNPAPSVGAALRQLRVTPAGERALQASGAAPEEAELEPAVEASGATADVLDGLDAAARERAAVDFAGYQFRTTPYAHQQVGSALCASRTSFALLMEMGTGKTKCMIDALSRLIQLGRVQGALIVCPLSVVWSWQREIDAHSPLAPEQRRVLVLTGTTADRVDTLRRGESTHQFFVTNFAALLRMEDKFARLLASRPLAMVVDESTGIKNHAAKQTKAARRLGQRARARYIMTGSPVTQSPMDAFAQFAFLDPGILGHRTFTSFKSEYGVTGGFKGKEIVDFKNLDRLAARVQSWSYRVLKKDCLDLPEKTRSTIELSMGPRQAAVYKQMRDDAVAELEGQVVTAPIVLTRMLRLAQITSGYLPRLDDAGKTISITPLEDAPKLPACLEVVQTALESGQKVIVWSRFVADVDRVAAALGSDAVAYQGRTRPEDRQGMVDAFQNDPNVRVFVGQIQTGGMAITLTAASTVIYFANSFSLADRLQSEDRAHRIGQRRSVEYVDLVCRGTVDRLVLRALREKKGLADIITGDNVRELLADFAPMEEEEEDKEWSR